MCVATDTSGPWGAFESISSDHPGLRSAFLVHGLQIPGEEPQTAQANIDISSAGVSLKALQTTWNSHTPISPTNAENPVNYKAAHGSRTTVLLGLTKALHRGGVLEVTMGDLYSKPRDLSIVVRQVLSDDDE